MGDHATDYVESSFGSYADEGFPPLSRASTPAKTVKLQFKGIINETDKAWQLRMTGDTLRWFPKSKCKIEGDHIVLPEWLEQKMIEEESK